MTGVYESVLSTIKCPKRVEDKAQVIDTGVGSVQHSEQEPAGWRETGLCERLLTTSAVNIDVVIKVKEEGEACG